MTKYIEALSTEEACALCADSRLAIGVYIANRKMILGGTLTPLYNSSIIKGEKYNRAHFREEIPELERAGIKIGGHRDKHYNKEKNVSGCGFADKLREIHETVITRGDEIIADIVVLKGAEYEAILQEALAMMKNYSVDNIEIYGNDAVSIIEEFGGEVPVLDGEHNEFRANLNEDKKVTLNIEECNEAGEPEFGYDINEAVRQTEVLVGKGKSKLIYAISAITLVATKYVLGSKEMPVLVNQAK